MVREAHPLQTSSSENQLLSKDSLKVKPEKWIKSGVFSCLLHLKKVEGSLCMLMISFSLILRVLIVVVEGERERQGSIHEQSMNHIFLKNSSPTCI